MREGGGGRERERERGREREGGREGIKVKILSLHSDNVHIQAIRALPLLPHLVYLEVGCFDQVLLIVGPSYVGEDVFK